MHIDAALPIEFTLEKETFFHRMAKTLGFATEFQTHDLEFDAKCYILCDDVRLHHALRGNTSLRRALQGALIHAASSIKVKKGRLVARMHRAQASPDKSLADPMAETLYKLKECAQKLGNIPGRGHSRKAIAHIAIGLCIAIAG